MRQEAPAGSDRLVVDGRADFLLTTGQYAAPRHALAVSGYITNPDGHVLMALTAWCDDTWELPGGQVEQGEEPVAALLCEAKEETGIQAQVHGLTGLYYSTSRGGVCRPLLCGAAVGDRLSRLAKPWGDQPMYGS